MQTVSEHWRRGLIGAAMLMMAACAGSGGIAPPGPSTIPDINTYPPLPNDAAPGASTSATATAAAIGRGVNFGNMLEAPAEGAWGLTVTDDFIDKAAAAGFASVRLPVRWSNHASVDAPFTIDAAFMARVESIVDKLLAKGVVVVLNMHHYRQLDGDPVEAGELSVDNAAVDVRFVMLWDQIAARFQGRGPKLVFELYNEPHGRLEPRWNDLMSRGVRLVRLSNPHRVIVVGPVQWNSARGLPMFSMPPDPDLVLTVHHYDPFAFTHQGAPWVSPALPTGVDCCSAQQVADVRGPLATAQAYGARIGYPVYVGEFGAFETVEAGARKRYTRLMRSEIEARGMTWTYWELAGGFGFVDPATATLRPGGLHDALFGP